MDGIRKDLAHAARALARRPAFTATALLTIAVGIAANSAVFTVVDALLLAPLPFGPRSERVVALQATHPTQGRPPRESRVSLAELRDMRSSSRLLEDVGGYLRRSFTLSVDSEVERVEGAMVTANLFALIGAQPLLGRTFLPEEGGQPGFEAAVVLSHRLWQRRFGGDPAIVGGTILVNQRARTVVGVMREGFGFPEREQMWVATVPFERSDEPRDRRVLAGIASLREGVTLEQAQQELGAISTELARQHPDTNRGWAFRPVPFREVAVDGGGRTAVLSLLGAVAFVLLIGCANLANLLLARGVGRRRELAVRAAVGASRAQVIRLMVVESLLLAAAGAVLGALLGRALLGAALASWPEELPYWIHFEVSARVVAFLGGLAVLTALVIGLVPALRSTRTDVIGALKEEGRSAGSSGDRRLQGALVVGQVALCLALLVGANLMVRSFLALQTADAGFDERGMVSLRVYLPGDTYDPIPAKVAFFRRVADRLRTLPGVEAAAVTSAIPADDGGAPVRVVAEDRPVPAGDELAAQMISAQPELFDALGVRLVAGRTFTAREDEDPEAPVAIVNGALARRLWEGGDALGRRLGLVEAAGIRWLTVVGIAPEVQYEEFGEETSRSRLHVYVPYAHQYSRYMALLVRGTGPADALVAPVRRAMADVAPEAATFDLRTMPARRLETTWSQRFFGKAMALFAAVALFLACLGIYGVLTYAVSRRTREIGVRMALGASSGDVLRQVVAEAGRLGGLGIGIGVLLAAALARVLQGILFGVRAGDPLALFGMAAALGAAVLAAAFLPARAAARTDPLEALRQE